MSLGAIVAANPLVGTWRLVSNHSITTDGQKIYPYGEKVSGFITYTADGRMAVAFGNAERRRFPSGDRAGASVESRSRALLKSAKASLLCPSASWQTARL